jgi:hypothetical protein
MNLRLKYSFLCNKFISKSDLVYDVEGEIKINSKKLAVQGYHCILQ